MPKYYRNMQTRIPIEEAQKFENLCLEKGCTPSKILHDFILGQIKEHGEKQIERGREEENKRETSGKDGQARKDIDDID